MPSYNAPLKDMMFLYEKLRDNKNYNELEKYKEVNPELVKDILEEAAKINQEHPRVIKKLIRNISRMVGLLYLVIQNMEDKVCLEQ